jgi:RNA polymerase sigma-70 factor (ECF subfamily)
VVKERDDAALVRAAQAGQEDALGALLERHRARLYAVAAGMLGHGADAEDAVQDTLLIALRRIGELREPGAAGGWLVAILVNVCRAQLRRPVREWPDDGAIEPRGALDTVAEAVDRSALRDWVSSALERLPEPQRLAIMLRYFSAASSYEAIAELCGVPVGTVRSRLSTARTRLADELLATAAQPHRDRDAVRERALATGAALTAFARSGNAAALETAFTPDLSFRMFDRVERRGRELFAALLAGDFEDGVTARPQRAIPGERVSIVDVLLESPADAPLHCPPAVTQVHFHDGGRTHRLVSYYAARP